MKNRNKILVAWFVYFFSATLHASDQSPMALSKTVDTIKKIDIDALNQPQQHLLDQSFPKSTILSICSGNFSGQSNQEVTLVIAPSSPQPPANNILRIGLILSKNGWIIHEIDNEIKLDAALSNSSRLQDWNHTGGQGELSGKVKCNVVLKRENGLNDKGKILGRNPFFTLGQASKAPLANTCYSSSAEYNNWDCIAYDPRKNRFRLWYQQVLAD